MTTVTIDMAQIDALREKHITPLIKPYLEDRDELLYALLSAHEALRDGNVSLASTTINAALIRFNILTPRKQSDL